MYGNLSVSQVIKKQKSYEQKKVKKDGSINERNLTAEERAKFMEAKVKELKSFFENGVWKFSSTTESDESRTLSSRMILKWSKHADGSPRAKARLIVRGYADKDALEGKVDTAAPTTSRLSRSMLLSVMSTLKWNGWTADVSTAFLQGLPQERKLWVKFPREALTILGADENTRVLLKKPLFLLFEKDFVNEAEEKKKKKKNGPHTPQEQVLGEGRLSGVICIHVDDMFGGGAPGSKTYEKQAFNFRERQTSSKLEYCGATLEHHNYNWKLHHKQYLHKVKPVRWDKNRKPEDVMTPCSLRH